MVSGGHLRHRLRSQSSSTGSHRRAVWPVLHHAGPWPAFACRPASRGAEQQLRSATSGSRCPRRCSDVARSLARRRGRRGSGEEHGGVPRRGAVGRPAVPLSTPLTASQTPDMVFAFLPFLVRRTSSWGFFQLAKKVLMWAFW